jgi:proline racemase/trans-L-3-hydroxyproline dehydratase
LNIETTDYHTAGEPFRIITSDSIGLEGASILDKRAYAREHLDEVRKLLVHEPRGHADMYGCFVTDPEDADADLGVVFFHNEGYSTACGHGTIALVTWALESGRLQRDGSEVEVTVDVPSGRLPTLAHVDEGKVTWVRFRNVPSFVETTGVDVQTPAGPITVDISYGGTFYASVDASTLGLPVETDNVGRFRELGGLIKESLNRDHSFSHPDDPRLGSIYGVIFFERQPDDDDGALCQRNVTVFADREVDRSPCGSGTSARLALLDASGELERGRRLLHRGVVGGEFLAWVDGDESVGERAAVATQVQGSAHVTGFHRFVLEPTDDLGTGFILR